MRYLFLILMTTFIFSIGFTQTYAESRTEKQSIIFEVEGDPAKHQAFLEKYYPYIDVIATYDILFNGLALQLSAEKIAKIASLDFIKAVHPVQTYEAISTTFNLKNNLNTVLPSDLNTTNYTGKGVKIAVIDTGIDYNHPDLAINYHSGYDLVDLDDDPMETIESQGIPTIHGTHVAGIIAANGKLKGVAPDSTIYAYRALGPGGRGSTVQILAAMEQAMKDGVDIMNLSLGNAVNIPDYPTSIAVNRAVELGVAVVIANGNNGPDNWTVGSPATASKAVSVGASSSSEVIPYLYAAKENKEIPMTVMQGSLPWMLTKDYRIVTEGNQRLAGEIALIKRSDSTFYDKAKQAQNNGAIAVLFYNNEQGSFYGSIENTESPINIPVAAITKEDGNWLLKQSQAGSLYMETNFLRSKKDIASFSSRGPVAVNWQIKPDILAPGTNILSTIPGDAYLKLQGTSMAAPHVAGAIAVVKEAQPEWSNEQVIAALKTSALQVQTNEGGPVEPISQGIGEVQIDEAIHTKTIITNPLLTYGKINDYKETSTVELIIENTTNERQDYYFDMPKYEKGLTWKLPKTFTLNKKERKKIPVELSVTTQQLPEEIHQGWLTLNQADEKYHLPYLFINKTADYPKAMGFDFSLKAFSEDIYEYSLYVTDHAKSIEVHLYDPNTLIYQRSLLKLTELKIGINEGELKLSKVGEPGHYKALITVQLENGLYESHESEIYIHKLRKNQ